MKKQKTPPEIIARFRTTEEALALNGFKASAVPEYKKIEMQTFIENFYEGGTFDEDLVMEKTYEYMDLIMKHGPANLAVCSRGCAHCCKMKVDVTEVEALYIQKHTNFKIKKKKRDTSGYCPLLNKKTGECRVYKYRPAPCRLFLTIDNPKYCEMGDKVKHAIFGIEVLLTGEGKESVLSTLVNIIVLMEKAYRNGRELIVEDIRYYFAKK